MALAEPGQTRLPEPGSPARELAEKVGSYIRANGLQDTSLRRVAAAIGTSDRMLRYYFGTREGMLAVAATVLRARDLRDFALRRAGTRRRAMEQAWDWCTDPGNEMSMRIFFHLAGLAVDDSKTTPGFLDGVVASWTEPLTEMGIAEGETPERAATQARLLLSAGRGLILDRLLTREAADVDAAFRLLLDQCLPNS